MRRSTRSTLCSAALLALTVPSAAEAATKRVTMGLPGNNAATFQKKYTADVNDFFPHGIAVNVGDKVSFVPNGFHNVDLPKRGGKPVPAITPNGKKVTGALDAAGAPFWFNGGDELGFNPALLAALFGKTASYDGSKAVNSGLPLADKPKPFAVKFTKTGSYRYYCDLHPGMTGTVRVKARRARVPSKSADAKRVKKQVAAALKVARTLVKDTKVPANTIDAGTEGGQNVHYFGFLPDKLTVAAGTTVLFRVKSGDSEAHTATAGPGNPVTDEKSYLGQIAASFSGPAPSPLGVYPSDPPIGVASLTPTLHGNGFWNTGVLDADAATPLPARSAVKLAAPGTYAFYCVIHPFMRATVTVK